ncbi:leukotriene A-4 hydrolase-like [Daphnia carinata]|uniref:leukotriene A-4 hydrolase-like n=1 Tax=Daphnia carinata TaxID=120202 RepID=UPI002580C3E6|nr:leukotriene A-4 hydrolase-like [Daphnia carinata]
MTAERLSPGDPNSFSRPDEVKVTHMDLVLDVSFDTKTISGHVVLSVEKVNVEAKILILDSRDLTISMVQDFDTKQPLKFELATSSTTFGEKLEIHLPDSPNFKFKISVHYTTSSKSTALQWLSPEQTLGKKHPFLFSQCQAIHCRSLIPCQDTPSNKVTYEAKITAPHDLTVLMSAIRQGEPVKTDDKKIHKFHQPVLIPSYLLAIVVGDLQSRQIGPRSHVWSEPALLDKAAYEFAETEAQLSAAEDVCGPYVWGVYDLLVLPPSFPFGGMENPCLTFVTPTLIAGDRSLVDVIAHEIAHSWTGNLVTNSNFEHFWLNEGFTVFVERKIAGRLHGEASRHFAAIGGKTYLADTIESMGASNPLTSLMPDLTGIDPDDSFSTVPYEKGQAFLWYLEELVGGPGEFDPFLKSYIANFQYRSIETNDFVQYLKHYFQNTAAADKLEKVDWQTWFHSPGMPPTFVNYDDSLAVPCKALCQQWSDWNNKGCPEPVCMSPEDLKTLSPSQIQEFLAQLLLGPPLSCKTVEKMQQIYGLDSVQNAEIKFRWLRLCLRAQYKESIPLAVQFATSQGRMKYCRPIFRDLYNWEDARPSALEAYDKVKDQWMYVCAYTVGKDLHVIQ